VHASVRAGTFVMQALWTSYSPIRSLTVRYEFDVAGARYSGDRIGFVGYSPSSVARLRTMYRTGNAVTVWYDPADPNESVLQRRAAWLLFMQLLVGGTFVLLGVVVY